MLNYDLIWNLLIKFNIDKNTIKIRENQEGFRTMNDMEKVIRGSVKNHRLVFRNIIIH